MNSQQYWAKREAEALKHRITDEKEYEKQLKQIYADMLDACEDEINAFYGKYASKEGITLAEAKKRVSKLDIAAYERKAKRYVRDRDFSAKANEEMRLYNATMKINRLEMLKANIGLELISGHDQLEKFMAGILKGRTEGELKRQAGILGKTVKNNAAKAHAIVNSSFHNATFSDRIWQYQDLMRFELSKLLQTGLIQGKNPRAIAKDLKKYWYGNDPLTGKGAVYCMERLMRTELARVQIEAQKQSYIRNGFSKYEFIVNGDCCKICAAIAGKHFDVSEMMPGENAPPMHPNCRCSTAAWEDSREYDAWLDHLAKGGSTEEWDKIKSSNQMAAGGSVLWGNKGEKISAADYKDIMSYARKNGIELSNFKRFEGNPQTIKELIDDANKIAKQFPKIKAGKHKLTIALDETMSEKDFAITRGHIISINANAYKDTNLLAKAYEGEVKSGRFVKGTDYHAIIMHETGHVVANVYGIDSIELAKECTGLKSKVEVLDYVYDNLSQYSADKDDGSEIIAECFAGAYGSKTPSKFILTFIGKCNKM